MEIIDFSKGERGKFYREDAVFEFPVYLNQDTYEYLNNIAEKHKQDISVLVNQLLENEIRNIELTR
jgi:hypothetical protein